MKKDDIHFSKSISLFFFALQESINYIVKKTSSWLNFITNGYMRKVVFLNNSFIGILIVWFLLCILPGDCFLLGCGEKDSFHCSERESAGLSHHDDSSSLPSDDQHCSHCCLLCAHNVVMGLLQNSSLFISSPSSRFQTRPCNHFKSIFQTIIYHPPRLAA